VAEKMWSYKEITQEAEARMTSLLKEAKQVPERKHVAHIWAYGIYLGWNSLTMGYQDPKDATRLEALALGSFPTR
jgi:hypothetical protein